MGEQPMKCSDRMVQRQFSYSRASSNGLVIAWYKSRMVDFNKRLSAAKNGPKPLIPGEIYEKADRESDTGPLRPAQIRVLDEWQNKHRATRDVIIKMHTGQGKTLIGLLILQAKLNENAGPALYICPNNYLVDQTVAQAKRFGIPSCTAPDDLPDAFTDSEQILITSVQKAFNGLTKFRLGPHSHKVGALVMDDCHACIDAINDGMTISLPKAHSAFQPLLALFSTDLKEQGTGTHAEIQQGEYDSFLPVPYWAWTDHHDAVADILAKYSKTDEVKYAWPLLKDTLQHSTCIISGASIEITPHLPPLERFGSYAQAQHRVFMSATVTNDAFLVKGLGLASETIKQPLVDKNEKWSGEKMILIPSLINAALDRATIIKAFAKPQPKRPFGIVAITPSFKRAKEWEAAGAIQATAKLIYGAIENLKKGDGEKALVIANRYDGIDLPDSACRVLIIDSNPQGETLTDRWTESCRATSEVTLIRIARTIEQGLGRSVRGEKDYSAIIITGSDLVKKLRAKKTRGYFSAQTQTQIRIGLEIADFAKEDITAGTEPLIVFVDLVNQCLKRDAGWKNYYEQQMEQLQSTPAPPKALGLLVAERTSEQAFQRDKPERAIEVLQDLLDMEKITGHEKGWYLQEMARYAQAFDKTRSNELQISAHQHNRYLLKPRAGMLVESISATGQKRIERLIAWCKQFQTPEDLLLDIDAITEQLRFGVPADDFEAAINDLGIAIGFVTQRPDKEWREGPDNLWALRDNHYLLLECKNQVDKNRAAINKQETGQMNNSCAWFKQHYPGATSTNMMIIWTKIVSPAGGFNDAMQIMTNKGLEHLKKRTKEFFSQFKGTDLQDLSETKIQEHLERTELTLDDLTTNYGEAPKLQ